MHTDCSPAGEEDDADAGEEDAEEEEYESPVSEHSHHIVSLLLLSQVMLVSDNSIDHCNNLYFSVQPDNCLF